MTNLGWSLETTLAGMGMVFALLIILMLALMAAGRIDAAHRRRRVSDDGVPPSIRIQDADGLSDEELAAVALAVTRHAETCRRQGALQNRRHPPGSRLWASRWVSAGRASQMRNTRRG